MSDLISRQAAIDLIKNDAFWVQYAWGGRGHKPEIEMVDDLVESIIKQMKESVMSRLKQMPSAQPEQRWIPCSERLPEKCKEVLVCYDFKGHRSVLIGTLYGDESFHGYDDEYLTPEGRRYRKAVAWMPLPEPYRAESEE